MECLEEKTLTTPAYGTIKFIRTEKGWMYQFDSILVIGLENAIEQKIKDDDFDCPPYYLTEEEEETGEYIPSLEDCEDECFYETFEKACSEMWQDMSNNRIFGTIAVWV
jgi:hypothetical protein